MDIRRARGGDEQVLATLNGVVQRLHVQERPGVFKPSDPEEVRRWFEGMLQRPATSIWIAEVDGETAGYVLAIFHERAENPFCRTQRCCEVDQIAVDPGFRGQGVARALVEAVRDAAMVAGIDELVASSWSFNQAAHRFFAKLGFTTKTVCFERKLP